MALGFLNIGTPELFFILLAALLLFGGKKLPELARGLGRGIREFKDASENIKRDISEQINNFEKDLDVKDVFADDVEKEIDSAVEPHPKQQIGVEPPVGTYQHTPQQHPATPQESRTTGNTGDSADTDDSVKTGHTGTRGNQTIR